MFPFASASLLSSQSATGVLDTQTVVTGASGTAFDKDRFRGFDQASVIGSISDGTSNLYSGTGIQTLGWNENGGGAIYELYIPGAADSGWTKLTIGSLVLTRASRATFLAGYWTWTTTDNVGSQPFGGIGASHDCVFT